MCACAHWSSMPWPAILGDRFAPCARGIDVCCREFVFPRVVMLHFKRVWFVGWQSLCAALIDKFGFYAKVRAQSRVRLFLSHLQFLRPVAAANRSSFVLSIFDFRHIRAISRVVTSCAANPPTTVTRYCVSCSVFPPFPLFGALWCSLCAFLSRPFRDRGQRGGKLLVGPALLSVPFLSGSRLIVLPLCILPAGHSSVLGAQKNPQYADIFHI